MDCGRRFCKSALAIVAFISGSLWLTACDMPRDPEDTTRKVQQSKVVRAGAVLAEPFVVHDARGALTGAEVRLVTGFADTLGARVQWTTGSEQQLMAALSENQLDLVVGGLTDELPYEQEVGLTKPYAETHLRLASTKPGAAPPRDLIDRVVLYDQDRIRHQAFIRKKKGKAVPVADLLSIAQKDGVLLAAEEWRLRQWGLPDHGKSLGKLKFVMAVPLGENRWLLTLEKFLAQQKPNGETLLQEAEQALLHSQAGVAQ